MQPEIHILGITLKSFGIVFACGFIAAGAILIRRLRELGKPVDWAYEMAFAALVGGLVGSRVYYVVQNYSQVKHDLIGSLFSGSGLVWYGGVIGGAIAVVAWARWRGMLNARPARPVLGAAGDGLRDRPDRLPGVRRRRLRQGLEPADGDGLPARDGADPAGGDGCSRRRSTRRSRWGSSPGGCGGCAIAFRPGALFAFYLLLPGSSGC